MSALVDGCMTTGRFLTAHQHS